MKIGIVYKEDSQKAIAVEKKIAEYIVGKGHEVLAEDNLEGTDYIVTLGGDGTLIHKACEHAHFGATFVGINTGNLGFLTAAESDNWQDAVDSILNDKLFITQRISLDIEVGDASYRAVNEAVIKGIYRVVELSLGLSGDEFLKVVGDGVIVATQTGSTAYSLSAGGPIVDPCLDSFLITPVNPIGLPIPSAVMSAQNIIEVIVNKGDDVSLIIDGQEHTKVTVGQKIKITKGEKVKFGYLSKNHFITALNKKFGLAGRLVASSVDVNL